MEAPDSPPSHESITTDVGYLAATATATDQNVFGRCTGPFCQKCQVVQFNDRDQGGQIVTDSSGEEYVSFGKRKEISLVYEHEDTLPDLPALSASAQNGCELCRVFEDFIPRLIVHRTWSLPEEGKIRVSKLKFKLGRAPGHWRFLRIGRSLLELHFNVDIIGMSSSLSMEDYFLVESESGPCATWLNIRRRPIPSYALSDLGVIRLKELINTHIKPTPRIHQGGFLPTRLLYVGQEGRSPRLMETHSSEFDEFRHSPKNRYVALSYRWGDPSDVLKTTNGSFPEHRTEIPMGILPGTFRDVVLVARALDIQFVWIDALCIIQGHKEDWERESLQMKNVFDYAYVTVCALQGNCSNSGFLQRQRNPSVEIPFRSFLSPAVSGSFHLRATLPAPDKPCHSFSSPSQESYKEDVKWSTWYRRGWTFQESWAQSMQLNFGSKMVHCISNGTIEAENGSFHTYSLACSSTNIAPQPHITRPASGSTSQEMDLYHWFWILSAYTRRQFTYENDRLPAISGIAKTLFCDAKEGDYLAGLWRMDLHRGLLWMRLGYNALRLQCLETLWRSQGYVAPSWSWANQTYGVLWPWTEGYPASLFKSAPKCRFFEAESILEGQNPFGRVKGGHLKICGKMCAIGSPGRLGWVTADDNPMVYVRTMNGEFVACLRMDFGKFDEVPIMPEGRSRGFEMLLTTEFDDGKVAGLVLFPVDDENPEGWEYWRVGVWVSQTSEGAFVDEMEEKTIRVI